MNVKDIVTNDLCTGCGTCVCVCPNNAIKISENAGGFLFPQIQENLCDNCSICYRVCSGRKLLFKLPDNQTDPLKGDVIGAYLTRSVDTVTFSNGQSGGTVTALLSHLINIGNINKVLVTRLLKTADKFRPEPVWAKSINDLYSSQGSKYCQVPLVASLKDNCESDYSAAIVGLGCHVHGLRNLQSIKGIHHENGPLVVGLICAGIQSFHAIDYLVSKSGVTINQCASFRYKDKRYGGWPGNVSITAADGVIHEVPKNYRHLCKQCFDSPRCSICFDQMNIFSDIVAGDPWGINHDKNGYTILLVRTNRGMRVVQSAKDAGVIEMSPLPVNELFKGQSVDQRHRIKWSSSVRAWNSLGKPAFDSGIADRWMSTPDSKSTEKQKVSITELLKNAHALNRDQAISMAVKKILFLQCRNKFSFEFFQAKAAKALSILKRGNKNKDIKPHFVLVGARISMNFGGPSLLSGTIKLMSRYFPDATYTLLCNTENEASEQQWAQKYGVGFIPLRLFSWKRILLPAFMDRLTGIPAGNPRTRRAMRTLLNSSAIIDIWGISFTDTLGKNTLASRLGRGRIWILGKLFGKPVIKYTSAIGPCRSKMHRFFASLFLNRFCDLVIARDSESLKELENLKVNKVKFCCPDTAITLDIKLSSDANRLNEMRKTQPIIGISVSFQAFRRAEVSEKYIKMSSFFIERIISTYNAHVILIPNELSNGPDDDRKVASQIYSCVPKDSCEIIQTQSMLAEEIKGIISVCDAVIAARYHSVIAALSSAVPVIAVSWHYKYSEVMNLFNQDDFIFDVSKCNTELLIDKFELLWRNRNKIRKDLQDRLPEIINTIREGMDRTYPFIRPSKTCTHKGYKDLL